MSTQTVRKTPTSLLGPWLVWGFAGIVVLTAMLGVAMWVVPRFAPAWVAAHSPFFEHVLYALEQDTDGSNQAFGGMSDRLWEWNEHAAWTMRRRLENLSPTANGTIDAELLQVMCSRDSIQELAQAHMPPAAAAEWAAHYMERQQDDLQACGELLLNNPQAHLHSYGANCLGALANRRSRQKLEAHLNDADAYVAHAVRDALQQIHDPASVPVLCQAVLHASDPHPLQFLRLIDALVTVVPEEHLLTVLAHPSRYVRGWAFSHLEKQRTAAAVPVLLRLAADEDPSVAKRARNLLLSGNADEEMRLLIDALSMGDVQSRAGSAWVLSALGDRRAVLPLLDLLVRTEGFIEPAVEGALLDCFPADSDAELQAGFAHRSGTVRAWIARRLGVRRLPDAPEFLLAHVDDPEPQVRAAIYRALGELRARDALPVLQRAMDSGVIFERAAAIRALGDMKDPAYLRTLSNLLQAKERRLRQAAAQALGALGDPTAMAELRLAQDDLEPAVREAVRQALEQLSGDGQELRAVEGRRLQEFAEPAAPSSTPAPVP
jgi:HEAT repeat protein